MIRAELSYSRVDASLYYRRTRHGLEVDCVIYGPEVFAAVEINSTARLRPGDDRGLPAFTSDYPQARSIGVYRGDRELV